MMRTIVIGLLLWMSTTVRAQPSPPSPQPQPPPQQQPAPPQPPVDPAEEAKRHFEQGVALLQSGNNAAALAELTESYRLRPVAAVLKNIAVAQQGLFRYSEAVASLQKYLAESKDLTPQELTEVNQLIGEMRSLLADISVAVTPAGATISVDGRPVGMAPLAAPLEIAAGIHVVEVTADGHQPSKREITVAAGVAQELKVDLAVIINSAHVRIKTTTKDAAVTIDGKAAGLTPVDVELKAGGHTLEVSAPRHRTYRSEIAIAAGQDRDITVPLELEKRWYQNWKILTAIGATVGVSIIGLAVNYGTTEGPLQGTLNPGVGTVE